MYNIIMLTASFLYLHLPDLEYTSLVWGEEMLSLLCPPAGEEPYLALPELIQKVRKSEHTS